MKTIDVREIDPVSLPDPGPAHPMSEGIRISDMHGRTVDFVRTVASGDFLTQHGIVARADLGEYILRILAHPSVFR